MNFSYAERVRATFDTVVGSGRLDGVRSASDFGTFVRHRFVARRREEVRARLGYVSVQQPDRREWAACREEVDESRVQAYVRRYFHNPPMEYLWRDGVMHMYYAPQHFLMAVGGGKKKDPEARRVLKLLSDVSFERESRALAVCV